MSVTVDIFIRFRGSKKDLIERLSNQLMIPLKRRDGWFLGYIELNVTGRREAPDYFTGTELRPYNFVLGGTVYAGSSDLGEAWPAHGLIMEILAQVIAGRLRSRTMSRCELDQSCHFYRPGTAMQRKKGIAVVDERTGRAPKHIFR